MRFSVTAQDMHRDSHGLHIFRMGVGRYASVEVPTDIDTTVEKV